MIKAAREAKVRTSWTETEAAYEEALLQFVRSALEPRDNNLFLRRFPRVPAAASRASACSTACRRRCAS